MQLKTTDVNLMVALEEEIPLGSAVRGLHPLGSMKVCIKYYRNPFCLFSLEQSAGLTLITF